MKLISIFLVPLIFISCNKKTDVPVKTNNTIEPVVLSEEESRLLCDEIISTASDSKTPILLLVSNIQESPLLENDRKRLLDNKAENIILTKEWAKATIQIESARRDQSAGIMIPVSFGEGGGCMSITYQFIDTNGAKTIVPGSMSTIFRVYTYE